MARTRFPNSSTAFAVATLLACPLACSKPPRAAPAVESSRLAEVSGTMLVYIGDPAAGGQPAVSISIVEAGGRSRPATLGPEMSLDRRALELLNQRQVRWLADTGDGRTLVLRRLLGASTP